MKGIQDLSKEHEVVDAVRSRFPNDVINARVARWKRTNFDINKDALTNICNYLKDELEFDHCSNITATDRSKLVSGIGFDGKTFYHDDFRISYHLWSYNRAMLAQLNLTVPRSNPRVKSVARLWRGADWHEREQYDLMGVIFDDHPCLRRIDLPADWVGHPLRKDYQIQETSWLIAEEEMNQDWPLDFVEPKFYHETYHGMKHEYGEGEPRTLSLRLGPQHPGTHGPFLITAKIDGEIIVDSDIQIGYLHRGQEKIAENREFVRFLPNSDRYCWLSSISNQLSYVMAVEEVLGVEVPRRAQFLRVIMLELNRIASHLLWLSAIGIDVGALTGFFYPFREREFIYDLLLMATGNRMNYNYARFGGVFRDIPDTFEERARKGLIHFKKMMEEYEIFFDTNKIFLIRTQGVGHLGAKDAINFGVTGPVLRGAGVKQDVRINEPYLVYDELDFEIPTEPKGDLYSWYRIRMREMKASAEIVLQCLDKMPEGLIWTKNPPGTPEGSPLRVPPGEACVRIEEPRGEFVSHLITDGSTKPYRLRIKAPEFINISALPFVLKGEKLQDAIIILGGFDPCIGGIDR